MNIVNQFFADAYPDRFINEAHAALVINNGTLSFKIARNKIIPTSQASKDSVKHLAKNLKI